MNNHKGKTSTQQKEDSKALFENFFKYSLRFD